jgi:predicted amidohydrolase
MMVLRGLDRGAVDFVMFPELSLSNYDPDIAVSVAVEPMDSRLDVFQGFADSTGISVGIGVPTRSAEKPLISAIIFSPGKDRRVISKRYLHSDEFAFFALAIGPIGILDLPAKVAVAICYEISVAAHIEDAVTRGIHLYLASVAKTSSGVAEARTCLSTKARYYHIPILMVNCVGTCEGKVAGGGSMVIDDTGEVIAQLGGTDEGLLIYDSALHTAVSIPIKDAAQL